MPRMLKAKREAAPRVGGPSKRRRESPARVPTPSLPTEEQPAYLMMALIGSGPTPREGLTDPRLGFDSLDGPGFDTLGAGVFGRLPQDDFSPVGYTPAWADAGGAHNPFGAAVYA